MNQDRNVQKLSIDLRSDTVTLPTPEMYEAIASAGLGDDGLDRDPTARELEAATADMLGKEEGVYFPSCTMANLAAIMVQAGRQDIVLAQEDSHIYGAERGGTVLTGAFYQPIRGERGAMDLGLLSDALDSRRSKLRTALVCLENTHNSAGGTVLSADYMRDVAALAHAAGAAVHLDGARMFNAATFLGVRPSVLAAHVDTVAVCLSKGLSAPMGAVLVCPAAMAGSIRNMRRALGGGQRQVGVVAAAGLVAIRSMVARLGEDHETAARLSACLSEQVPALRISVPQTNIVMVDTSETGRSAQQWATELAQAGVLVRPWGKNVLRCVTHRHIRAADIDQACRVFASLNACGG